MAARGGGFGSDAGPGDPLPPPPRSSTIVQTRDELPSPRVELRKATVVVPPGGLPAAGAEAEPSTPSTLAPPEVDEPAAPKEPAEPDKPMTVEELGAAQTRLMDNNPFLSEDE
jgi:hypothetical protein